MYNSQQSANRYAASLELTSLVGFFGGTVTGILKISFPGFCRPSFSRSLVVLILAFCRSLSRDSLGVNCPLS